MKRILLIIVLVLFTSTAQAASWYVDNSVGSNGNGISWATAWKNISNISWGSVNAGDIVYISGGSSSQTYNEALGTLKSGNVGNPITISTGQEAGHNGTVIFNGSGILNWLSGSFSNITITGNVGGANHMTVQNFTWYRWYTSGSGVTVANDTIRYVNFPNMGCAIHFSNGTSINNIEFDHCMLQKLDDGAGGCNDVIYGLEGSAWNTCAYGRHRIHDCSIYVPGSGAFGDDGIKWGCGIDFYNNYVKYVIGAYANSQHADMFQLNESYYRIYNNTFEDIGESIVYHDSFGGGDNVTGLLFYNNIVGNSHQPQSDVARALDLIPESTGPTTFTDFIVANNTFVDWTQGVFLIREQNAASYTNCYIKNNIYKNVTITTHVLDAGVSTSNNTTGNPLFTNYSQYAVGTNNFHLTSSDTIAKDQGTTLASPMSLLDKDGVTRPQGSAWDIGTYEYPAGVQYTVTASAGSNGSLTCTSPVNSGSTSSCTATPNAGYQLWAVSGCNTTWTSGNTFSTGAVTANCTVTVTFITQTYTLGGVVSGLTGTVVIFDGSSYGNLTITANGSYSFLTPYTNGGLYGPCVFISQPSGQTCSFQGATTTGNFGNANITNLNIACQTITTTTATKTLFNGTFRGGTFR